MQDLVSKLGDLSEEILDVILRYDFREPKGIVMRDDERNILFEHRFRLLDLKEEAYKYDESYLTQYIEVATRDKNMAEVEFRRRLRILKKYHHTELPQTVLNVSV